ncbi:MAG: hypothetical protein V1792_15730 [Pseudomonadota bacterium]
MSTSLWRHALAIRCSEWHHFHEQVFHGIVAAAMAQADSCLAWLQALWAQPVNYFNHPQLLSVSGYSW